MSIQDDDISRDYLKVAQQVSTDNDVRMVEEFAKSARQGRTATVFGQTVTPADPEKPVTQPKPIRAKAADELGRLPPPESGKSAVSRNLGEIPGAVVGGVESAIKNSVGWAIDPLANWLNENVADLSYTRDDPKTMTGQFTKGVTEFLTGFIPALKGMRAAGVTDKIVGPMAAGAIADFAVRDPASGRLADLWKQFDLPQNILTEYLSSKPEDTEAEARFKNALEGMGLGVLAEGVFLGARMIKAARGVRGAAQSERAHLKSRYGEITDETFNDVIGDPSKPSVEMKVHKPGPQADKIREGLKQTADVKPTDITDPGPGPGGKAVDMGRRNFLKGSASLMASKVPGVNIATKVLAEGGVQAAVQAEVQGAVASMIRAVIPDTFINTYKSANNAYRHSLKSEFLIDHPDIYEKLRSIGGKGFVDKDGNALHMTLEEVAAIPISKRPDFQLPPERSIVEYLKKVDPKLEFGEYDYVVIGKELSDGEIDITYTPPIHYLIDSELRKKGIGVIAADDIPQQIEGLIRNAPPGLNKKLEELLGDSMSYTSFEDMSFHARDLSELTDGERVKLMKVVKQHYAENGVALAGISDKGYSSSKYIPMTELMAVSQYSKTGALERINKIIKKIQGSGDEATVKKAGKVLDKIDTNGDKVSVNTFRSIEKDLSALEKNLGIEPPKKPPAPPSGGEPPPPPPPPAPPPSAPPPKPEDYEVYVNFARFDEPDEIKRAIGEMVNIGKGSIDEARRGVITQAETKKLADNLGMTVPELLARRKGQPFNAEEALAARQLWAASAEKLTELAKLAASKNASPLEMFAFRKQMAIHHAIQSEVIGARTETARALASWRIEAKGGIERARAVDMIMNAMGGPEASGEMARRLAILTEVGTDPAVIAKFVEKGALANSADVIKELWINGLLSSPKTHVVNIMSNTMVATMSIAERATAGAMRALIGGDGVRMSEAAAMAYGMIASAREAFRMSAKALRTGNTSWTFNKVDLPKTHALSAEGFGMSRDTAMGRFVDLLGNFARVPTRLLGAEDEFFKTIGYRMEVHAQAVREASREGLHGEAFGRRVAELVTNPPEHMMINAADMALYNTFTNEVGWFGAAAMNLRNAGGAINPSILVFPFVRTPVNLVRFAMERTPFAPLVGQWRADIAAGGARADLALARMSAGTMTMLTFMDLADKGLVTGHGQYSGKDRPVQEALDRQGVKPYSVKIGDRWYSYNRTDPFGMTLGFAASIAESVKRGEIDEDEVDEWHEAVAMSIAAVSQTIVSKTYLEGLSNLIEVMSDPSRYSQRYIDDLVASFLPGTALQAAIKNVYDPVSREVQNPADAVYARIAGLSKDLPPRRNLWGEELRPGESGLGKLYDFISPVASKEQQPNPIDSEMVRLQYGVPKIAKNSVVDGVRTNMRFFPRAYDDYVRLAGNDLKHPAFGMGAKDYLNAVVGGKHPMSAVYTMMSDQSRIEFIQNTISTYRKAAQRQVLGDPKHRNFANEVSRLKQIHQQSRMPVME